jgi:Rrf2 family protein
MKLSRKSEYACLALIDLCEHLDNEFVKIRDISERKDIPKKFLEQILATLRTAGYVKSRKGADGGYKLAKPPQEITVAEIVRLMDGALAPVESASKYFFEHTPIERNKKLLAIMRQIRDYTAGILENTTFRDLA